MAFLLRDRSELLVPESVLGTFRYWPRRSDTGTELILGTSTLNTQTTCPPPATISQTPALCLAMVTGSSVAWFVNPPNNPISLTPTK